MTSYRDRHLAGLYSGGTVEAEAEVEAEPEAEPAPLPRTHADLDALAEEREYTWSGHDLTIAEKQAELG